jgi:hypothetical protein
VVAERQELDSGGCCSRHDLAGAERAVRVARVALQIESRGRGAQAP